MSNESVVEELRLHFEEAIENFPDTDEGEEFQQNLEAMIAALQYKAYQSGYADGSAEQSLHHVIEAKLNDEEAWALVSAIMHGEDVTIAISR